MARQAAIEADWDALWRERDENERRLAPARERGQRAYDQAARRYGYRGGTVVH